MRIVFDFGFLRQRKSGKKLRRSMRYRIQQPAQLGKPIPSFRRVAASFNRRLEVLRRGSHETTGGLRPYQRGWAGRVAVGEGPEAGLLEEPTWAEGDSHTVPGAAAGIDYSRAEGRPGALRTTVTQNPICAGRDNKLKKRLAKRIKVC